MNGEVTTGPARLETDLHWGCRGWPQIPDGVPLLGRGVVRKLVDQSRHLVGGPGEPVEELHGLVGLEVVRQDFDREDEAIEAPFDVVAESAE